MMTIQIVSDAKQAKHYFEKDNYYLKDEGLASSAWMGKLADELGLSGQVDSESFYNLLKGQVAGQQLGRIEGGEVKHTPGWDCTFNAPKSVSIAAQVFGDSRLIHAHQEAVKTAMAFLEKKAALTRLKVGNGVEILNTGNLLVAAFQHDTSRDLDPHLHTHCVVINATSTDRGIRSLHSRKLYDLKMTAGLIYQNELAAKVRKLGYTVEQKATRNSKNSVFEIGEVSQDLISEFSQRRNKITEYLEARGIEATALNAQRATLNTRPGKQEVDRELLLEEWRHRAAGYGVKFDTSKSLIKTSAPSAQSDTDSTEVRRYVIRAINNVSRQNMSFTLDDVSRDAISFAIGKATLDEVGKVIQQTVREKLLMKTNYSDELNGDPLYTTPRNKRLEEEIIKLAKGGKNSAPWAYKESYLDKKLGKTHLNDDQKNAVITALSSQDRFVAIQGLAGVGKTTLLAEIVRFAKKDDINITGVGPTHTAVKELQASTGISSVTLTSMLSKKKPETGGKNLWIVDESGFISATDKIKVMRRAEKLDAKVLFVGDERQLGSIEAGRAFHLLMRAGVDTAKVSTIVRQKDGAAQLLANYAAAGLTDESLDLLIKNNRLIESKSRDERIFKAVDLWHKLDDKARENTLILASTNSERREINNQIKDILEKEQKLTGEKVGTFSLTKKQFTPAELRYAHNHELGEYIRFERDYKKIDVAKGDYFKVVGIDKKNNKIIAKSLKHGQQVTFNPGKIGGNKRFGMQVYERHDIVLQKGDKVLWKDNKNDFGLKNNTSLTVSKVTKKDVTFKDEQGEAYKMKLDQFVSHHFDFRYSSTVYSAQGRTSDHVIAIADTKHEQLVNAASFYVAVSRPRYGATVITDSAEGLRNALRQRTGLNTLATDEDELKQLMQPEKTKGRGAVLEKKLVI